MHVIRTLVTRVSQCSTGGVLITTLHMHIRSGAQPRTEFVVVLEWERPQEHGREVCSTMLSWPRDLTAGRTRLDEIGRGAAIGSAITDGSAGRCERSSGIMIKTHQQLPIDAVPRVNATVNAPARVARPQRRWSSDCRSGGRRLEAVLKCDPLSCADRRRC
jgi:hypothetical protein